MNICKLMSQCREIQHNNKLTRFSDISHLKRLFPSNGNNKYHEGTFLIIEIYDFSIIKNTYGYEIGQEVLKNAAYLLNSIVTIDSIVCRGTGDGIIVFLPRLSVWHQVNSFCEGVFSIFKKPLFISGKSIYIDMSIGAAIYSNNADSLTTVLKKADLALYKSKKDGVNKVAFYYEELQEEVLRKIMICNNLRSAASKNELEVYYQPQVEAKSGRVLKFEALLRWKNEELGNVPPSEFIPISEETGIIIELGDWIIRTVCRQIKEWIIKGYYYTVAINVSQKQIQGYRFLDNLKSILREFDIPPNLVEIEVTESMMVSSYESIAEILQLTQSSGIKIALDDFGTGYSSLSYLKRLPIDTIKIDKSFLDDIVFDSTSRELVSGIIMLGKKLKLNVIAEGVESKEQVDLLERMGCNAIQGYYYSKPLPAKAIESIYLGCEFALGLEGVR
ncbi:bifunctional diguanylate cyclase/phosphodiesterase [Clostridium swellfunianum]|uniref:putative bifunctional diguanylate cyclase/phosphodiesterase n=1 Tax=Clostridium swellfunianum TaxID=1367462 RepID=UPI0020301CF4|nr:bifunctional diguanylate cyclase/phosphodiesterase [Clostridium swellfunianum]MCM0648066.1 bifunctional diguanylate cyclase/phosphodiesterase [Clostridium swellfunianum]